MNKNLVGVGIGLLIIIIVVVVITAIPKTKEVKAEFVFESTEVDLGIVKQSGGTVIREFEFTYNGNIEREVLGVPGSCACTKGDISVSKLIPGTKGRITVEFDPNLHEEPDGRFYKTVSLVTDPPLTEDVEVKIWAEIDLDLGPEFFTLTGGDYDSDQDGDEHKTLPYGEIHADELLERLDDKDFFLLDVHVPEQVHIEGTDAFIDYTKVEKNLDQLPSDKDAEIIIYCRSGGMSQIAAQTLIDNGYTNVLFLEGGANAFNELTK